MRIFVSVDLEGVAGVATLDQTIRGGGGYPRAQELMTQEANAAIRGAFAGGATEVLVNDSHGTMDNLLHDRLDPRATVLFGGPRASCMAQGVEVGDALAVFVGYHAPAGAHGVLAHTFCTSWSDLRLNGLSVSEAEVNALLCAAVGVPIGVLAGDDEICALATKAFPGIRTVETKAAHGWSAAASLHPQVACERIEAAVTEATRGASDLVALELPAELVVEADFVTPLHADFALTVPGGTRVSASTLRYVAADTAELMRLVSAWNHLAGLAGRQVATIAMRR